MSSPPCESHGQCAPLPLSTVDYSASAVVLARLNACGGCGRVDMVEGKKKEVEGCVGGCLCL